MDIYGSSTLVGQCEELCGQLSSETGENYEKLSGNDPKDIQKMKKTST